jgi:hypothetical protein
MGRRHELVYALNAGAVDPKALARVDLEKMRLAGEHPIENWMPDVLGPMTIRPGLLREIRLTNDAWALPVPFVRDRELRYILLLSTDGMRVFDVATSEIVQVAPVSTLMAGNAWSDQSTGDAATAVNSGVVTLTGNGSGIARVNQAVAVAPADQDTVNVLRVDVGRGPVRLRVGSSQDADDIVGETTLREGIHKLGFTPGRGTIYVDLQSEAQAPHVVSQIQFEAAYGTGDLLLPHPWATQEAIERLRMARSLDVLFASDGDQRPQRIEHRGRAAWSVCDYREEGGPYRSGSPRIGLTPDGLTGVVTVTASQPVFSPTDRNTLLQLEHSSERVEATLNAAGEATDYITVSGINLGRQFRIELDGSPGFIGTVALQQSTQTGEPTAWTNVAGQIYIDAAQTNAVVEQYNDESNNVVVHYRMQMSAYTQGSVTVRLRYDGGQRVGQGRILVYNNARSVSVEVLERFGAALQTFIWRIGEWRQEYGFPRVPVLHDGRLVWFRGDQMFASVTDDYTNFDALFPGDAGPVVRSIGAGGSDSIYWAISQQRLLVGALDREHVVQSSEFDAAITPTDFTVRSVSRRGSADVMAAEHDDGVFFVQRAGKRLYDAAYGSGSTRYVSEDVSRLNPAATEPGVVDLSVQMEPETRLFATLANGDSAVLTWERQDNVAAFSTMTTAFGTIERSCVVEGVEQDDFFCVIRRGTRRYLCRMAAYAEQESVDTCALLDGGKVLTGSVSQIKDDLALAGETVSVWAGNARHPDVVLDGTGSATLNGTYSRVVYGLPHTAKFKSVKLAYAAEKGTAISQRKRVSRASVLLANSCLDGIQIGTADNALTPLPMRDPVTGLTRAASQFYKHYDNDLASTPGKWGPDTRFCIQANSADGPVTVQAIVLDIETNDDTPPRG